MDGRDERLMVRSSEHAKLPNGYVLTANGLVDVVEWVKPRNEPPEEDERWAWDTDNMQAQVATARLFLMKFGEKTKKVERRHAITSSYGLKHLAERWSRDTGGISYICNGAMILAAALEGYIVQPDGGPNALINISRRAVRAAEAENLRLADKAYRERMDRFNASCGPLPEPVLPPPEGWGPPVLGTQPPDESKN